MYTILCFFAGVVGGQPHKQKRKMVFLANKAAKMLQLVFPGSKPDFEIQLVRDNYFKLLTENQVARIKEKLEVAVKTLKEEEIATKYRIVRCIQELLQEGGAPTQREEQLLNSLIKKWQLEPNLLKNYLTYEKTLDSQESYVEEKPKRKKKRKRRYRITVSLLLFLTFFVIVTFIAHKELLSFASRVKISFFPKKPRKADKPTIPVKKKISVVREVGFLRKACLPNIEKGLLCVAGDGKLNEKEISKIQKTDLSYYIKNAPISGKEYKECIRAKHCSASRQQRKKQYFLSPTRTLAQRYCHWKGMELASKEYIRKAFAKEDPRFTYRCMSYYDYTYSLPTWIEGRTHPQPPELQKPRAEVSTLFREIEQVDSLNKPLCENRFRSPANCKDPVTYIKSNEPRGWMFVKYIKNLAGGYMGVGADANYSFIAAARSEWAWLFDFDKNIVNLHRMLRVLLLASDTPKDFVAKFSKAEISSTIQLLQAHKDKKKILNIFRRYRVVLWKHYKYSLAKNPYLPEYGWLSNADSYRYIRQMYMQNRILIVSGDMLKGKTMRSIAKSAKKMQIPVRVYYPSNVEMFWEFNKVYRENVMNLPFDDKTIIISTVGNSWHRKGYTGGYWHYLVRGGIYFQRRLLDTKFVSIKQLQLNRYISKENGDLSIIGVPSSASFPW
ncbi:MAG: hypothetical protein AAF518_07955 [Spirochaetota bacterium]